jgi:hypothetical protein
MKRVVAMVVLTTVAYVVLVRIYPDAAAAIKSFFVDINTPF